MFGWILKTDWDIKRLLEFYRGREILRPADVKPQASDE
jgi:hypothetical protein